MSDREEASVSVVIATYNRCDSCARAVASALDQTSPPLEVIVCDDGSTDRTRETFSEWAAKEPRLRYLRLALNTGAPAAARNRGVDAAAGEWVAFLDDDDRWVREKLAVQRPLLESASFDVVAAQARRSDGGAYFAALAVPEKPARAQLLRDNWIVLSTAVARRSLVLAAGGFPTDPRIAGIFEDYCLWLNLADAGARFAIVPEALAVYETSGSDRLSREPARRQRAIARYALARWRRHPRDIALAQAALVHGRRAVTETLRSRRRGRG